MRNIFLCSLFLFIGLGLVVNDASAGRFGGGRGFGMARSKSIFTQAPRAQKTTFSRRSATSSRWRGALTGLLLGSLLTSLFMGHGFGSMLVSWLLIAITTYLIVNFIRRRSKIVE